MLLYNYFPKNENWQVNVVWSVTVNIGTNITLEYLQYRKCYMVNYMYIYIGAYVILSYPCAGVYVTIAAISEYIVCMLIVCRHNYFILFLQ